MQLHRQETRSVWANGGRLLLIIVCLVGAVIIHAGCATTVSPQETISLFDGVSLRGWDENNEWFRVEEGAIVAGSMERSIPRHEYLCTTSHYRDFELRLKAKLKGDPELVNGGVMIRSRRTPDGDVVGYQADMRPHYWGSLYDSSRRRTVLAQAPEEQVNRVLKADDWNDYVIRCQGKRIELWINGYQTVDYTEPNEQIEQAGIIGLQIHSGVPKEAWYKDIRVVPINGLAVAQK